MTKHISSKFVVVGGGIAGVTCVETLSSLLPDDKVLLITSSDLIKAVTNYQKLSRALETFDVEEKPGYHVESLGVEVLKTSVVGLDAHKHILYTVDGLTVQYDKLCICSGGSPKLIGVGHSANVLGIRDTESVEVFQQRLTDARRILLVGNGGIATELVYEIDDCEVVWAVKDKSISATFIDAGAAEFFLPLLNREKAENKGPVKRLKYTLDEQSDRSDSSQHATGSSVGVALGPDWASNRHMTGNKEQMCHNVHVEYCVEVDTILTLSEVKQMDVSVTKIFETNSREDEGIWPVYIRLTNGKVFGCDFIVSATGVVPNTQPFLSNNMLAIAEEGGIQVNAKMETSLKDVYAAGDVCTAAWDHSPHWLQMRLWSQARQMGCYAAKCIVAAVKKEDISLDFCFELFAHVTTFFNFKVVLLGRFNAQGLGDDYELLLRVTKGEQYVKVVLQDGRMKGAVLIGETDLEETFENLILNNIDLTPFKDHLLDPNIDIEDFFD